jgi:hypothetical protein
MLLESFGTVQIPSYETAEIENLSLNSHVFVLAMQCSFSCYECVLNCYLYFLEGFSSY